MPSRSPATGSALVHVGLGGLDEWPEYVQDCAQVAERPLPSVKPEGALVTWTALAQRPGGLVGEGTHEDRLDASATARLDNTTPTDEIPAPWEERTGTISVTATVARPHLEQLRQLAIDKLLGQLPSFVRAPLLPWLRPIVDRLTNQLDWLITSQKLGRANVVYHVPAATPAPSAMPAPTAAPRSVMVRVDRADQPPLLGGRILDLVSCSGPYVEWTGVMRTGGVLSAGLGIPFVELPLDFSFRGAGGIRSTTATTSGTLVANLERLTTPFTLDLGIVVDGRTMSISAGLNAAVLQMVNVQASSLADGLRDLPIVPAPPGTCP